MTTETDGASVQEQLIEACRRNNTDLLEEILAGIESEDEVARLLNETTTVMGNHLYHEAAAQGHYDIIDMLLDQPNFECDPLTRSTRNTPLHLAVLWLNAEPRAQRPFGSALIKMMLEAGSSTRLRNAAGRTPAQLVDPDNTDLLEVFRQHDYAELNHGDFVNVDDSAAAAAKTNSPAKNPASAPPPPPVPAGGAPPVPPVALSAPPDDDDEFSGSDEEERQEWLRRKGR
ncbi:hypothetical protein TD95_004462 [Thielaviopsis punctulata]|uniref:Uncharacterized protein n=1 Tax=Thielaviopsis punctulata TaxID=72032 RepID=A0A0F4ZGR8_9PEZI|nr:hypothetical protein TD95_004462 [Thielaviopsis punctulata]